MFVIDLVFIGVGDCQVMEFETSGHGEVVGFDEHKSFQQNVHVLQACHSTNAPRACPNSGACTDARRTNSHFSSTHTS